MPVRMENNSILVWQWLSMVKRAVDVEDGEAWTLDSWHSCVVWLKGCLQAFWLKPLG